MCELFGFCGKKETELNGALEEFFSHSPENPNGWGMAIFKEEGDYVKKECIRADRSSSGSAGTVSTRAGAGQRADRHSKYARKKKE